MSNFYWVVGIGDRVERDGGRESRWKVVEKVEIYGIEGKEKCGKSGIGEKEVERKEIKMFRYRD